MRPPKPPKATQGKEYIEEIKYKFENKIINSMVKSIT